MPKTNFIKIRCPRCKFEQLSFSKASSWVKCSECNKLLIQPQGGKAKVKAQAREITVDPQEKP